MAKYEVEIDDATALRWCFDNRQFKAATEINSHQVSSYLEGMVALYGNGPKIRDKRDEAAMTICRAIAAERAAAYGNRERGTDINRVAEDILRFMLGGG